MTTYFLTEERSLDLMKVLKSLEELLYELVSWLVFYPVTMWRSLTSPRDMMRYADVELADKLENQYDDTLSPPLFLLITLLISHGLSTAFPSISNPSELPKVLSSGTNLLIARGVVYGIYPLSMAVMLLRMKSVRITRASLRPPFYSQCYVAAPFAFVMGLGFDFLLMPDQRGDNVGLLVMALAVLWYGQVQVRWFRHDAMQGAAKSTVAFAMAFLIATVAAAAVTLLIGIEATNWSF